MATFPRFSSEFELTGETWTDFIRAWEYAFAKNKAYLEVSQEQTKFFDYTFKNLWQEYPSLAPIYSTPVDHFDANSISEWMYANMQVPVIACILYMVFVFGVQRLMVDREAYDLRGPLGLWNLFLSTFSFLGALNVVPHLFMLIYRDGFQSAMCYSAQANMGTGTAGLWVILFILSKFPELVDTAFIVLRKKNLIFLHWYHHITVLLFCWHSFAVQSSAGLFFVAMNYSVHAIMYLYYFLNGKKMWPRWIPVIIITLMQLGQMVLGVTTSVASYYHRVNGNKCNVPLDNLVAGSAMYFSYFLLFFHFLLMRFVCRGPKKANSPQVTKPKAE